MNDVYRELILIITVDYKNDFEIVGGVFKLKQNPKVLWIHIYLFAFLSGQEESPA